MKKLILIDGNALVHRAFHALPPLTSPKGVLTNAVFGFSSILMKVMRELKPEYIVATFDLAGPTFRHEQFADYKAKRVKAPQELYDQIPMVKDVVRALGIPIFEKEGYEADDVIGTIATHVHAGKGVQVVIVTGDLDTLQLVRDKNVIVFTPRKGVNDTMIYDEDAVKERYGLAPQQVIDFKGLKGDPSDNIPGVPGVGEKTASTLIQQFGNLENLYEEIKNQKSKIKIADGLKEKLLSNEAQAFFSKQLATIVCDLDVGFSLDQAEWRTHVDTTKAEQLFRDFGFQSLIKRLSELRIGKDPQENQGTLDFSLTSPEPAVVIDPNPWLEAKDGVIGHDLKVIYKTWLTQSKLPKKPVFDTKIAAYLLNMPIKDYVFVDIYHAEFGALPSAMPEEVTKLADDLRKKLDTTGLRKPFEEIEMPLIPVLANMELRGIAIDTSVLKTLLVSGNKELTLLEKGIFKHAGREFNINSPSQLGDILFNTLGLKGKVKKTGGGALSTAASELEKLRDEHPIIELIMQYRELQKLKTTYIEPFPTLIAPDGRIHTTYNQAGTVTGRISSQDPNLQNIPIRTELGREFRKAFISEKGFKIISCDYSQIDLRMVAHLAQDKTMIAAFKNGEDIHTRTAAQVFNVPLSEVTKDMRRQAKTLNFGVLYGMGTLGFARAAGVDRKQAGEFIERYFTEFSGVKEYMEGSKEKARKQGYLDTLFGHRRYFPDITSTMPMIRAQAERMAINLPVQGTAADVVKMAMIKVNDYITQEKLTDNVRMLLQVHDELVFEIKEDLVSEVAPKLKDRMESVHKFDVPLVVDVKAGKNWEDVERIA